MDFQKPDELKAKIAKLKREGEERSAERLAQKLGYQYVDLGKIPVSAEALKLLPEARARDAKVATIELKLKKVALAAVNPKLPATLGVIKELEEKKYEVKIFIASLSGLEQIWNFYKFITVEAEDITGTVNIEQKKLEALMKKLTSLDFVRAEINNVDFSKAMPTILIEMILAGAMSLGASDIHLEISEEKAKARFRVDGVLHDVFSEIPLKNYHSLTSRIKLLAGLKINIIGEPQDGRFTIDLGRKEIEVRVSIIPAEFGENVVMRILDPDTIAIDFIDLGIRKDDIEIVHKQINKPNGLILNTGPTGSGKTTTLYAFLRQINNPEKKIITLEDPIEYRIPGIEQTQVDSESGFTFANGLRAIVRQDPDVVLVGEIRDLETADIAIQASLTGHLVLSTLHTNDAVGAVPRLINLGVKAVSIGPSLNLVIAQRLVRKLCLDCRKAVISDSELDLKIKNFLAKLPARVNRPVYAKHGLYEKGSGCAKCSGFGYRGRIGIYEFLEGGLELEQIILKEPSELALKKLADSQGMVTMQEDGILKVLEGKTTFEEIINITGEIIWKDSR